MDGAWNPSSNQNDLTVNIYGDRLLAYYKAGTKKRQELKLIAETLSTVFHKFVRGVA